MTLTQKSLMNMLANAAQPAAEQVVIIKPLRSSVRFKKDEWNRLFPDWQGIALNEGNTVSIVPTKQGGPGHLWRARFLL